MQPSSVPCCAPSELTVASPAAGRCCAVGEVVFNTSLTGYQEILTDPSYKGEAAQGQWFGLPGAPCGRSSAGLPAHRRCNMVQPMGPWPMVVDRS